MPLFKPHWNLTYVRDKLAVKRWEKLNGDKPWLVAAAVEAMGDLVRPGDTVVEFGSGRSTKWFAQRVGANGRVISIEDYQPWYDKVKGELQAARVTNVEYLFVGQTAEEYLAPATAAVGRIGGRIDVALVDGFKHRDHAALWSLERVRPGGLVIVDNINWYLPHATRTPQSVGAGGAPATELWSRFAAMTSGWRRAWFTSGVSDTAVYVAPVDWANRAEVTVRDVGVRGIAGAGSPTR